MRAALEEDRVVALYFGFHCWDTDTGSDGGWKGKGNARGRRWGFMMIAGLAWLMRGYIHWGRLAD